MAARQSTASPILDWEAIRRDAEAAVRDFLDNRWEAYLAMVERVEAWPENQDGADKTWIGRANEAHRQFYRRVKRVG